jgi:hypothetical protein
MTETTHVAARALPERLLTVEDLERLLQVDRRTVARLCQRGQLPSPLKWERATDGGLTRSPTHWTDWPGRGMVITNATTI